MMQVEENSIVQISDSELKQCKEYAIGVEMDSETLNDTLLGGKELLNM